MKIEITFGALYEQTIIINDVGWKKDAGSTWQVVIQFLDLVSVWNLALVTNGHLTGRQTIIENNNINTKDNVCVDTYLSNLGYTDAAKQVTELCKLLVDFD